MRVLFNLLYLLPAAFLVPIIHEWVRAMTSHTLGDTLPSQRGFVTANPLKFFEPIGFIFMLVFQMGWGQPVPTSALRYKNRQLGSVLVGLVPILVSLAIGIIVFNLLLVFDLIQIRIIHSPVSPYRVYGSHIGQMLYMFARLSISFSIFNLIPIYPLSGQRILTALASPNAVASMTYYEKSLQFILVILMAIGLIPAFIGNITNSILMFVS